MCIGFWSPFDIKNDGANHCKEYKNIGNYGNRSPGGKGSRLKPEFHFMVTCRY